MTASTITKSFLSQGIAVISIAVSSVVGFNYLADRNDKAVAKAMEPFVKQLNKLDEQVTKNKQLIADNFKETEYNTISLNLFLDYYNTTFHREFLRPIDIEEQTYKRRRR